MRTYHFKTILILQTILFAATAASYAQQLQPTLKIGDPAPVLNVQKWIKGDPVTSIEPGTVYVVEFSGVNCAPCRASIPHLSELAREFKGKVKLINIYVYENGLNPADTTSWHYEERVRRYIAKMGNQISYTVGLDNPAQFMVKNWMIPSRKTAIPIAFVIDQHSRLVWSGHPTAIKVVVKAVLAGSFVPEAALEAQKHRKILDLHLYEYMKAREYKQALNLLDTFIKKDPSNSLLYSGRFTILLHVDEKEAFRYGWALLHGKLKDHEPVLFYMSKSVLNEEKRIKQPDWDLGLALAKRALSLSKSEAISADILSHIAKLYVKKGAIAQAITAQEQALAFVRIDDPKMEGLVAGQLLELLEQYKQIKNGIAKEGI